MGDIMGESCPTESLLPTSSPDVETSKIRANYQRRDVEPRSPDHGAGLTSCDPVPFPCYEYHLNPIKFLPIFYIIYMLWSICRVHMIYEHARHVPTPPLLWLRYAKARTRQRPRTLRLLPIRGLNLLSPEISSYVAKLPPRANAEKTKGKKTNMERKARPMAREAANWRGPVAAVWTPFGHTAAAPCPKRGRLGMMVLKNRHQWSQVHVPLRKGKASRKKARQNMQHDQNKHPRRRQPQSEKQRQRQRQQSPKQRPGEGLSLNHMIPKSFVNVSWLMRSMHSRRLMTSKTFALKFLQTGGKRSQLRSLRSTPRAWFLSSGGSQSRTSTGPEVL